MDATTRRKLVHTKPNPHPQRDIVTEFHTQLTLPRGKRIGIHVRYVPDKNLLVTDDYGQYLSMFETIEMVDVFSEELAGILVDDLNSEVVPRWVQVRLDVTYAGGINAMQKSVILEDRQPGWDNNNILLRIAKI